MAVLIWLLAKFMRHDEGRATATRKPNIGDHLLKLGARILNLVLDLVFLPVQLALQGLEALSRLVRRQMGLPANQPVLNRAGQRRVSLAMRLLILVPFMIFVLFPFYWVIVTSLKSTPQISQRTSIFWPDPFTLDQYAALIWNTPFLRWLGNSVLVATVSTVISVSFAALAAYALSRLKFVGAGLLTTFLLITYLLPGTLLFIPLYQILASIGLINSYTALMLTYPTFLLPFATWVMLGYFRSIPVELEEAAMIDGAYPSRRLLEDHAAAGGSSTSGGDAVRLHQRLERVPVRVRLHHQRIAEDPAHRVAVHGRRATSCRGAS